MSSLLKWPVSPSVSMAAPMMMVLVGLAGLAGWTTPTWGQDDKAPQKGDVGADGLTPQERAERDLTAKHQQFVEALIAQSQYDLALVYIKEMEKIRTEQNVPDTVYVRIFERNRLALKQLTEIAELVPRLEAELKGKRTLSPQEQQLLELCKEYPAYFEKYLETRRKVASDPERLSMLVGMLGKAEPVYRDAAAQLKIAGPYAMPELLLAVSQTDNTQLLLGIERCVREYLQYDALDGLVAAVRGSPNEKVQDFAIRMLGQIRFPAALPVLAEVAGDEKTNATVRDLARKAVDGLGLSAQLSKRVPELYYSLAVSYFDDKMTPRPAKAKQTDVWVFEGDKLSPVKVAYEAYFDAMARKAAYDAIRTANGADYPEAWGLMLCATHRFEANQAADGTTEDPLKPVQKWLNSDYVTALAGPVRISYALRKGLDPSVTPTRAHTAMNVKLLSALATTGGARTLQENVGQTLEVLSVGLAHPDLQIRVETAINAVRMKPARPNTVWSRVVPALAEAVAIPGKEQVLLITDDQKVRDGLGLALEAAELKVTRVPNLSGALEAAARSSGFAAVIFTAGNDSSGGLDMAGVLGDVPSLKFTPKLILTTVDRLPATQAAAEKLGAVYAADVAMEAEQLAEVVKTNVKAKATLSEELSESYALKAIDLLARLADTGDVRIFNYLVAEGALAISADDDPRENVATAAAKALGVYPTPSSQRALADIGTKDGPEPVRLAALSALADNARRNGNLLTKGGDANLVEKLGALSQNPEASQELRTGAVAALGALSLQGQKVLDLYNSAPRERP